MSVLLEKSYRKLLLQESPSVIHSFVMIVLPLHYHHVITTSSGEHFTLCLNFYNPEPAEEPPNDALDQLTSSDL